MLDFSPVYKKEISFAEFAAALQCGTQELANLTNEMVDAMLEQISDCVDADVTFVPEDSKKHDPYAASAQDADLAWTLGHVIVHTSASAEESAVLACELARGVPNHGRSRYETAWEGITTVSACRQRLEESRRIRLASLQMWPDVPNLELSYQAWPGGPQVSALGRFVLGLMHDDDHLGQMREIVRQVRTARA